MISQEAIQKILGIEDKVYITPKEMADKLNITFFPYRDKASEQVLAFEKKLREALADLQVNIVPYEKAMEMVPLSKRFKRAIKILTNNSFYFLDKYFGTNIASEKYFINPSSLRRILRGRRLKKGVSVVVTGEQHIDDLPMQYISSFKDNSVVNILDFPANIKESSEFKEHFDTAMGLFAYHMANIVIAVDKEKWMLYNFNASHPVYRLDDENFKDILIKGLIPKIVAPISPHKFEEFHIKEERFGLDKQHSEVIESLHAGAREFETTKLFPEGKKIDELPFRDNFHKLIGKLHLDNRSGMSFGFIAKQMPVILTELVPIHRVHEVFGVPFPKEKDYFILDDGRIVLSIDLGERGVFAIEVPEVWVLSQRSGANKTNFDKEKDLIKLGLLNGDMWMQFPQKLILSKDYKPSFDTKVILAHAVGNALLASVMKYFDPNNSFSKIIEEEGLGMIHWHGYINPEKKPHGMEVYGNRNPHVACSSPQSAIYALDGKIRLLKDILNEPSLYKGDIHVEPHHGSNVTCFSIKDFAVFLREQQASVLGNKYLRE